MRILSVDFNYFVYADETIRELFFPKGGCEYPQSFNNIVWANIYARSAAHGQGIFEARPLLSELHAIRRIINIQDAPVCMVADSHIHAFDFILEHSRAGESIEVYNIDYHHDTYGLGQSTGLNCGNWLRLLMDCGKVNKAYWVNQCSSHLKENKCDIIPFSALPQKGYSLIYVCRSSWRTPPHLDRYFISDLALPLYKCRKDWDCKLEKGILDSRYNKEFREAVEAFTEVNAQSIS